MSLAETHDDIEINFEAAEMFLQQAKEAHASGDQVKCFVARKMVAVALHLAEGPVIDIRTKHLKG